MVQEKQNKSDFLIAHPICCFCGGHSPSTTIDHQPTRSIFTSRQWPEGYEFPACKTCNLRTRHDEQVIALYSHLGQPQSYPASDGQFERLVIGVRNNFPEMLPKFDHGAMEKRQFLRQIGRTLPHSMTTADLHLAELPPAIDNILAKFGTKLFCALHYKEQREIFPNNGAITVKFTAMHYVNDAGKLNFFMQTFAKARPTSRGKRNISPEFAYRYASSADRRVFGVFGHLRSNLVFLLGGSKDRARALAASKADWFDLNGRPLNPEVGK